MGGRRKDGLFSRQNLFIPRVDLEQRSGAPATTGQGYVSRRERRDARSRALPRARTCGRARPCSRTGRAPGPCPSRRWTAASAGSRPRALARPDAAERRASSSPRRWRGRHDGGGRSPRETSRQRSSSSRRTRARGRRRAARSRPRARRSRDRRARRARARWRSIRGPRIHRSSSPRGSLSSRRRRGTRARTPTSRPRAFSFPFRVFPRTPGAFRVRGVSGVARARVCTRGARRCVRACGDDRCRARRAREIEHVTRGKGLVDDGLILKIR